MRRIQANEGCELPSAFVCVDTETFDPFPNPADPDAPEHHVLRLGCACGWRREGDRWTREKWIDFTTHAEFWGFVAQYCRPRQPVWIYAHKWEYDAQVLELWELIDTGIIEIDWKPERKKVGRPRKSKRPPRYAGVLAIDGSPWWAVGRFAGGIVKLVDTMNYWRCSLAELGASVRLPQVAKPNDGASNDDWQKRCRRDVEILVAATQGLMRAWRCENLGNWQPTVSMLAYSSWRHCGLEHDVVSHQSLELKAIERESYVGGESTQWFRGLYRKPVHEVDLASAYPEIMATVPMPWKVVDYVQGEPAAGLLKAMPGLAAIAKVTVNSVWGEIPKRTPDRVTYPLGEFTTCLAGAELLAAHVAGEIVKVHEAATYRTAILFAKFVRYWQRRRREAEAAGDVSAADLAKLLPMALYGRLALKPVSWIPCKGLVAPLRWGHFMAPHWKTGKPWKYRAIAGMVEIANEEPERENSLIQIPACITAELRHRMRRIRDYCPERSVLVQVVDALWVTDDGLEALKACPMWGNGEPGKLRLKRSHKWISVDAPNCFRTDLGEIACGVPIKREWNGADGWKIRRATTTRDVIARGPNASVGWRTTTVPKWRDQSVGIYRGDGWREALIPQGVLDDELPVSERLRRVFERELLDTPADPRF